MGSHYRGAELVIQPRIRKSALFDASWRYGCRHFSVYNRTYIASRFHDPEQEYRQVIEKVALWPVAGERQLEITGPDAARFAQYLTPRDLSGLAVGQCKYVVLTDEAGGIINDPILLRLSEDRFWLSLADSEVLLWAKGLAVHGGFEVSLRDPDVAVLQVQGPRSPDVMAALFDREILDLRYYHLTERCLDGTDLVISRTGWSSEFGYEIYLADASRGDALFDAVMAAGEPFGIDVGCVSQIRRIEGGLLSYGLDMTLAENPFEMGLGRLVDLDQPADFVGKAALARIAAEGVTRRHVGLFVDGERLAANREVWPILDPGGGEAAGKLTSLTFSPRLARNIALGLVRHDLAAVGTELSVATDDGLRRAVVARLPFLPKKQQSRPKG